MKTPVPSSFPVFRVITSDGVPEENATWPIADQTPGSNTPSNTGQCDREKEVLQGLACVSLITGEVDALPLRKLASHAFYLLIFSASVSFPSRRI